jgi:Zn-dependent protease
VIEDFTRTSLPVQVVAVVLTIILHEIAHGWAALALGDDTAKRLGRLSLNPIRHIDRVGTLLVPGILLLVQYAAHVKVPFLFGWAKPVPISAWKFPNPRRGMMIVAAAGPGINFLLAWLSALALHEIDSLPESVGDVALQFLSLFILTNLVLGLFNLLPIPPLDGGRIMVGLLPESMAAVWARLERAGIVIVVLLVFLLPRLLAEFGIRWDPVGHGLGYLIEWSFGVLLRLAGFSV